MRREVGAHSRGSRSRRRRPWSSRSPSHRIPIPRCTSHCPSTWMAASVAGLGDQRYARQPHSQAGRGLSAISRSGTALRSSAAPNPAPVTEYDLSMYLRPSRYAEADKFYGFRRNGIRQLHRFDDVCWRRLSSWVGNRLNYVQGSSDPIDGAVDTPSRRCGCVAATSRTWWVAMLRAVNVPARVVSVYAPGLYPMDFHAGCGRGVRRRALAGGRRDPPGAAPDAGADRDRTRCRRHRLPRQPQGCDHAHQDGSDGGRRRRSSQGLHRPTGVDRLTTTSPYPAPMTEKGAVNVVVIGQLACERNMLDRKGKRDVFANNVPHALRHSCPTRFGHHQGSLEAWRIRRQASWPCTFLHALNSIPEKVR